jgi:uncharacterized protein
MAASIAARHNPVMPAPPIEPSPVRAQPQSTVSRWLFKALAVTSLILGIIGAFVPVMPTVPFVLLAAWAATRGSPGLAHWLETHPRMGPMIMDWRHGGVVSRKAKRVATVTMAGGALVMVAFVRPWWVPATAISIMTVVDVWLWLRPEQAPD